MTGRRLCEARSFVSAAAVIFGIKNDQTLARIIEKSYNCMVPVMLLRSKSFPTYLYLISK